MPHHVSPRRFTRPLAYGLTSILIGSALAGPVFAHDTLPTQWCMDPNTTPAFVSEFEFAPAALTAYRARNPILKNPPQGVQCTDERSCGIVDDWFWANQMIQEFCSAPPSVPVALRSARTSEAAARTAQATQPMPFVRSPAEFNVSEHHQRYNFGIGPLKGVCVVCVPPQAPTPAPLPEADNTH